MRGVTASAADNHAVSSDQWCCCNGATALRRVVGADAPHFFACFLIHRDDVIVIGSEIDEAVRYGHSTVHSSKGSGESGLRSRWPVLPEDSAGRGVECIHPGGVMTY